MTGLHDNHNHLVASGDALAMVRAAEAAGLASFAFTEHVFHIEEARAASRYLGTRWDGELEGLIVTCPWHAWQFDITSGKNINLWDEGVKAYTIEEENGKLYLLIDEKEVKNR